MNIYRKIALKFKLILTKIFPGLREPENESGEIIGSSEKAKPLFLIISIPLMFLLFYFLLISSTPLLMELSIKFKPESNYEDFKLPEIKDTSLFIRKEENRISRLRKVYENYTTSQPYFVVNTTENSYTLYNRGKVVKQGQCSTGSYILLDAGDEKKWIFETPKGLFRIRGKTEKPIWKKPDWAFIEEGLPVPPSTSHLRYEAGVLGDYALSIGNGYLIHGTLYKRLLGMPVTHGCVRMDDADLEAVYNTLGIGSKVFIF